MQKKDAEDLLERYNAGQVTQAEKALVEAWYLHYKVPESDLNHEQIVEDQKQSLESLIYENSKFHLWPRLVAAAAVFIILFTGIYFFVDKSKYENVTLTQDKTKNDIQPGGNKATLTLANGRKVVLADAAKGKIAEQDGIKITKAADGQLVYTISKDNTPDSRTSEFSDFNTIETPIGGQYQINLPDGTKVWLNASSSLKFPARFNKNERRVWLIGEGYFEVAKNRLQPFKIVTDKQEIEVFGTHFNVNAYSDEAKTKTTLLEGSVKVTSKSNHSLILVPGQRAEVTGNSIKVKYVDAEGSIAWKNGLFVFDDEKIETIMRRISRWYDVDIVYKGDLSKETFFGTISRYEDINNVLRILKLTKLVHFKIEGRRIIVMP